METCLLEHFILNDQLTSTCDFDPTLLEQGPGIYEVFKTINGTPLFLKDHIERFYESAAIDNYQFQLSRIQLIHRLKTLIEINNLKNGNIRFQLVNHPDKGVIFIAWVARRPSPSEKDIRNGISLKTYTAIRSTPHAKRVNPNLWKEADEIITPGDISEVLLVNEDGLITEGSRSNIFFIKDNVLLSPAESLILKGITRMKIIELAQLNNIPYDESEIRSNKLADYDACFLSSTSRSVLHIQQIDNFKFQVPHPVILKLDLLYIDLSNEYLQNFSWKE